MNRWPGPLPVIGVCAAILYFGALAALSPWFLDLDAVSIVAPKADPLQSITAAPGSVESKVALQSAPMLNADPAGTRVPAPPSARSVVTVLPGGGGPQLQAPAPRAVAGSERDTEPGLTTLPAEERMGPEGQPYILRNFAAAETEANWRAHASAREAAMGEARSDPATFAAKHHLELEDVQAMLAGQRPFPDRLVAARGSGT